MERILGKELERRRRGKDALPSRSFAWCYAIALISRCPIVSEWSCGKGIEQAVLHRLRLIKFQIASIPLLGGEKIIVLRNSTRGESSSFFLSLLPLVAQSLRTTTSFNTFQPRFLRMKSFVGRSQPMQDEREFHQPRFLLGADWMLRFTAMISFASRLSKKNYLHEAKIRNTILDRRIKDRRKKTPLLLRN